MKWNDPKVEKPELKRMCVAVLCDGTFGILVGRLLVAFMSLKKEECWEINGKYYKWEELLEPFESCPLHPYILYWSYIDLSCLPECKWDTRVPALGLYQNVIGETQTVTEINGDSGFKAHWKTQQARETEETKAEKKKIDEMNEGVTRACSDYYAQKAKDDAAGED